MIDSASFNAGMVTGAILMWFARVIFERGRQ